MVRLEQELAEMRSLLTTLGSKRSFTTIEQTSDQNGQQSIQFRPDQNDANGIDDLTNADCYPRPVVADMDVIDRGIVSLATAQDLTAFFTRELTNFFPIVLSTSDMNAALLRQRKPILFLAILTASALTLGMDIAKPLQEEFLTRHAHAFFVNGEKSLELIQAVLLAAVYEYPPSSRKHLKLCQFTHVACTMALELALHVRFFDVDEGSLFDDKAAQARAILICYHLAAR